MTATRDEVFGCLRVTTRLDKDGYAFHGKTRAHIHAWVEVNGPVPEGLVLDHLCRRRNCKAVHHLEAVTQSENEKRKSWKYRAKRTHCPRGHELRGRDFNQVITPEGGVVCRACNKEARSK